MVHSVYSFLLPRIMVPANAFFVYLFVSICLSVTASVYQLMSELKIQFDLFLFYFSWMPLLTYFMFSMFLYQQTIVVHVDSGRT